MLNAKAVITVKTTSNAEFDFTQATQMKIENVEVKSFYKSPSVKCFHYCYLSQTIVEFSNKTKMRTITNQNDSKVNGSYEVQGVPD